MEEFIIENKLEKAGFAKLLLKLTYTNKRIVSIQLFVAFILLIMLLQEFVYGGRDSVVETMIYAMLTFSILIFISPWRKAKKIFKEKDKITEKSSYTFSEKGYQVIGETYNAFYSWEKMKKVKVSGNWLLIFHTDTMVVPISLTTENLYLAERLCTFVNKN